MKKATKINLTLLALALSANGLYAQQGFGTNQPSKASVIDLQSDSKGLLIPRVALTSLTNFLPVKGETATNVGKTNSLLVYNTATVGTTLKPGYYYWTTDGTAANSFWKRLLANDDSTALALAGDVTGTLGANVVGKIQGIPVTNTTPTNNQVLTYNGTAWTPTAISPATITGKGTLTTQGGIEFTGSTNGTDKLLGNATIQIADLGVTTAKLAADAVTNEKLADSAVKTENIANRNVTAEKLTAGTGTAGRVAVADANGIVTYTNAVPSSSVSGQDVTAASNKVALAGAPAGAALKAFSIDVNEANLTLNNIGGTLNVNKITSSTTNNQVLTTDGSGATVWADRSSLITGVSNTSTGNSLTTTVNGTTGSAVNIINSNALSLNTSNQLVSTVNGVASTALDLTPAVKANQQNTIVQGTGAISIPTAVTAGNNTTYSVGVNTATASTLGVVSAGSGLSITPAGVLSVNATATGIGKTLTGSGITVTAGSTAGTGTSLAGSVLADVTLGIADNAVNSAKIVNGSIQGEDLNTNVAGNGLTQAASGALQVNTYNGIKVNTTGTYNDHVGLGGALNEATTITTTATNTLALSGLQPGEVTDKIIVADTNGVLKSVDRSTFSADVRRIGTNHISEDAGVGSNGSAMPGTNNIAIGAGAMNNASATGAPFGLLGNVAVGGGNQLANTRSDGSVAIGYGNLPLATTGTNIAVGPLNLTKATTGSVNFVLGSQNFSELTTGQSNLAMGANNLTGLVSGANNHVFGNNSLKAITTQDQNIAIGSDVLATAVGEKNVGVGSTSLRLVTSGNDNVGLGVNSGGALTTGSYNTFFGTEAGNRLTGADAATVQYTSGNFGLFLGSQTKAKNTGDNQLNIGNWIYGENGNIALGNFNGATALPTITSTTRLDVVSGNVRIGTINANAGTTAHKMVVADADGVLKTVEQTSVAIEPWNVQSGTLKATANTDNIYQMGSVAIGKNAVTTHTASGTNSKFDVNGAVRIGTSSGQIGTNSLAVGTSSSASGENSLSAGLGNSASGAYSFSTGSNNSSKGFSSSTLGNNNETAEVSYAAALGGTRNKANALASVTVGGSANTAAGDNSLATGLGNISQNISEAVLGRYNAVRTGGNGTTWGTTLAEQNSRTLLQIGNGTISGSTITGNNALTLTQSGRLGVGITGADNNALPTQTLDVGNGNVRVRDINTNTGLSTDKIIVSDTDGVLKTVEPSSLVSANQRTTTVVAGTNVSVSPITPNATGNTAYTVSVQPATSSALGVVRPGTGLSISSGVLSVDASASGIGKTLTGSGITVTAGNTVGTGTSLANTVLADVTLGIADNAITSTKIANNAVTVGKLPAGASATTFLRGDGTWVTPTDNNTTYTASTSVMLNGTSFERAALTGDVTAPANSNVTTIANNAITAGKISDDAVTAAKINPDVAGNGLTQATDGSLQVNAQNGISVNNDLVKLGGTLTENTTLTNSTFDLTLATTTTGTTGKLKVTGLDKTKVQATVNTGTTTGITEHILAVGSDNVVKALKASMPKFFYMPSIIIPIANSQFIAINATAGESFTDSSRTGVLNLYERYKAQFGTNGTATQPSSPGAPQLPVLPASELHYYVTWYDTTIFQSVSLDATGKMTYIVRTGVDVTVGSFMNIVFAVKEG